MLDFMEVDAHLTRNGYWEIKPDFIMNYNSKDLMLRGGDFYAIWDEEKKLWSTSEDAAVRLIDKELVAHVNEHKDKYGSNYKILYLRKSSTRMVDEFHHYCQKQMREHFTNLDETFTFASDILTRENYASKRLKYDMIPGNTDAWDELVGTLYSEEEKHKIEWIIGCILSGDSKVVQKFAVMYGSAGTGKSTVLNIMQDLFDGYYCTFDSKALGSSSSFALESLRNNPLVAIQHDGDMSRIEDNSKINSIVSHESISVNVKHKSTYEMRFNSFLIMGTNKPVKITDSKSGIIRRLIDISPTGNKVSQNRYKALTKEIRYELGAIAKKCLDIYLDEPNYYDGYIPTSMIGETNDFYNFVLDSFDIFRRDDETTLKSAWAMYKEYCEDSKIQKQMTQIIFKHELKSYFREFRERTATTRNYYKGFLYEKFLYEPGSFKKEKEVKKTEPWLKFEEGIESQLDIFCKDYLAQYNSKTKSAPEKGWDYVTTTLKDIDTRELHWLKVPEWLIVIDFDIPDENGNKSFELNFKEAVKWPATYAELSKSGQGIHLHYIYKGDITKLDPNFSNHIEVKVYTGKGSLRRMLTKCNDIPIAEISSGLPLREPKKNMVNKQTIENEKHLKRIIFKALNKETDLQHTKPIIDFIKHILDEAYDSGIEYDVEDLHGDILQLAMHSTNNYNYCVELVDDMHFKSKNLEEFEPKQTDIPYAVLSPIVFFDCEVFPNYFCINHKTLGFDKIHRLINPTPAEVEALTHNRLVGFNCRRYDNHMLYARILGESNEDIYIRSRRIIKHNDSTAMFSNAYNLSYTDIYDYSRDKMSLKKWEIALGIHHQELGLDWDKPVPEELFEKVAEYCDNDVIATEAVWNATQSDFLAREILVEIANYRTGGGLCVNDTTNTLTTKIVFGNERYPQKDFEWRDMGDITQIDESRNPEGIDLAYPEYCKFNKDGKPIYPGYKKEYGKSTYRDIEVGEGGLVVAYPGMYGYSETDDVGSMHPSSIKAENLFGKYTVWFNQLLDSRLAIKHKNMDYFKTCFDGILEKYVNDKSKAKGLANALKLAINSVYGLTKAGFAHPFKDPKNIDNIVAKRGALFMVNLMFEVQAKGYTVIHIKTDSIKIENPDNYIHDFVTKYGLLYGYSFEVEHVFDKICLVNDAVYVAKLHETDPEYNEYPNHWTATGKQFKVPYVFKTLFSKEEIIFDDLCETQSVTSADALYLDINESLPDYSNEIKAINRDIKKAQNGKIELDIEKAQNDILELDSKMHDYKFIGKVGQFTPVIENQGGGLLLSQNGGKYGYATGAKGYRWLESELLRTRSDAMDIVDISYFKNKMYEALDTLKSYETDTRTLEWFLE